MSSQALLLCQDSQVLNVLQPVLAQTGVAAAVFAGISTAQAALSSTRFNPVIVDCDGIDRAASFLQTVRESGPNFESVALAIVRTLDGMSMALAAGANLVLWKPVTEQEAARVVRTTQELFLRRRRRFPRVSVPVLVYADIEGVAEPAILTDLSEAGLGVQAFEHMVAGRAVCVHFTVPDNQGRVSATAEVAWADCSGRAGLQFSFLPEAARTDIRNWMASVGTSNATMDSRCSVKKKSRRAAGSAAKQIVSAVVDSILVGGLTAVLGFAYYLATPKVPPEGVTAPAHLVTFIVLWLVYRFVFFRDPAPTPGSVVTERFYKAYFDTPKAPMQCVTPSR